MLNLIGQTIANKILPNFELASLSQMDWTSVVVGQDPNKSFDTLYRIQ